MATLEAARAEIREWLNTANNVAFNPDGHYGLQCVDLADSYVETLLALPWRQTIGAVAGARQLMHTANPAYFTKIWNNPNDPALIPREGDIIIWGGSASNPWGHVAVVISATMSGVTVIQQDGFAKPHIFVDGAWYSNKPAHITTLPYTGPGTGMVSGWLRPRPEKIKDTGALKRVAPAPAKPVTPGPVPAPITPRDLMNGIDISSHQAGINLPAVPSHFVIVKITGGTSYVNPEARTQITQARKAGKLVGLYHYAAEGGVRAGAKAEADHFIRHATPLMDENTNLVLDWENEAVIGSGGNVWARDFLDAVAKSTGKTPWLYTYLSPLKKHAWETVAKKYPLWLAWYGSDTRMDGYASNFTRPFEVPAGFKLLAWQYSQFGRLPGYGGNLDLNVFFGTETEWLATAKGKPVTPLPPAPPKPGPASNTNTVTGKQTTQLWVVVEAGDTLTSIATQFGSTVAAITAANPGINPNLIQAGQQLKIPGSGVTQVIVEAGDTLTSIAAQFGTTVAAITAANPGINPNQIVPGQVLQLAAGGPRVTQVVVEAGDTLTSIATQFGTTIHDITTKNPGINPNLIQPGQVLNI